MMIPQAAITATGDFICNKVIPAIQEKWPLCHGSVAIKIQQDNANTHLIRNDDPQLQAAITATGSPLSLTKNT
jgi:hypothetical protein